MKVLKIILGIIVVLVIIAVVYLSTLPSSYVVERSITIKAPTELIMKNISDFHNWETWSPWKAKDPNATFTYEGEESGVGSKMTWETSLEPSDQNQIGKGSIAISEIIGNLSLKYDFNMTEPWSTSSVGGLESTANENGETVVRWYDKGELAFMMRPMGAAMDRMIGPDFEKGLASLKAVVEKAALEATPSFDIEEVVVESYPYLSMTDSCSIEMIGPTLGKLFGGVMGLVGEKGLETAGQPFAIYHSWDGKATRITGGIPITEASEGNDVIQAGVSFEGNAIKITFVGPYENAAPAHFAIQEYIKDNELEFAGPPWEIYVTDPATVSDPKDYVTEIYYPIK